MRQTFKYLLIAVCTMLTAAACYKDLSTESTFQIPDIMVDTSLSDTLMLSYGDSLIIHPKISQKDRSEEDLEYLWEMDLTAGLSTDRLELGDTKDLDYLVRCSPSSIPYTITLTVTDKTTGYATIKSWKVYVARSLGEGIVVAYTRDGGKTSELDLISNASITYGFSGDEGKVTRNLFNLGNNMPIEGRVNDMGCYAGCNQSTYDVGYFAIGTDHHLYGLDYSSFAVTMKDEEFFTIGAPGAFGTTVIANYAQYGTMIVTDGTAYCISSNMEYLFHPVSGDLSKGGARIGTLAYVKTSGSAVSIYDEEQQAFYSGMAWSMPQSGLSKISSIIYPEPPRGLKILGCGGGRNDYLYYVIEFANGTHYLMELNATLLTPSASFYSLDGCEGIAEARNFCFTDAGSVFYYTSGNKMYYNIIASSGVTCRAASWTPESEDEQVTRIKTYYQAWYGIMDYMGVRGDYPFPLETNRKQLIITTYNEKTGEGKVYLQPFSPSTGRPGTTLNGVFSGFGEITAIEPLLK
ncbi:MAG: PKD-like family lipoprotein [Bacteroidales bacterium]|nr:PKD-like family lipoprotein [Bacteroidales bacterium]